MDHHFLRCWRPWPAQTNPSILHDLFVQTQPLLPCPALQKSSCTSRQTSCTSRSVLSPRLSTDPDCPNMPQLVRKLEGKGVASKPLLGSCNLSQVGPVTARLAWAAWRLTVQLLAPSAATACIGSCYKSAVLKPPVLCSPVCCSQVVSKDPQSPSAKKAANFAIAKAEVSMPVPALRPGIRWCMVYLDEHSSTAFEAIVALRLFSVDRLTRTCWSSRQRQRHCCVASHRMLQMQRSSENTSAGDLLSLIVHSTELPSHGMAAEMCLITSRSSVGG